MPNLNLSKSHHLFTKEKIDEVVEKNKVGNYALGYINDEKKFVVNYVGRSDTCIHSRLYSHEKLEHKKCTDFKFLYANSVDDAYEKECHNYHDFGEDKKLLNDIHPASPEDKDLECPSDSCPLDTFD
jgi:hypothetical protein